MLCLQAPSTASTCCAMDANCLLSASLYTLRPWALVGASIGCPSICKLQLSQRFPLSLKASRPCACRRETWASSAQESEPATYPPWRTLCSQAVVCTSARCASACRS